MGGGCGCGRQLLLRQGILHRRFGVRVDSAGPAGDSHRPFLSQRFITQKFADAGTSAISQNGGYLPFVVTNGPPNHAGDIIGQFHR